MSPEEEKRLIALAQSGDQDAMTRLLEQHHRGMYRIALRVKARGLDVDDLLQIAAIYFIQAVRRYDLSRSTRLTSWTYSFIAKQLFRDARVHGIVRLPSHVSKNNRTQQTADAFEKAMSCYSLDGLKGDDREALVSGVCDINPVAQAEHAALKTAIHQIVAEAFQRLPKRAQTAIRLQCQGLKLHEISPHIGGVTKERVRQIIQHGMNTLRRSLADKLDADVLMRYNAAP